jgi:hypothetical protein
MEKMKLIAISLILLGCSDKHSPVIKQKVYTTFSGSEMPKGICSYQYDNGNNWIEFHDSCSKYNIGDTLIGSRKH